jgi:hypothetical protein
MCSDLHDGSCLNQLGNKFPLFVVETKALDEQLVFLVRPPTCSISRKQRRDVNTPIAMSTMITNHQHFLPVLPVFSFSILMLLLGSGVLASPALPVPTVRL